MDSTLSLQASLHDSRDAVALPVGPMEVWCAWPVIAFHAQSYRILLCLLLLASCAPLGRRPALFTTSCHLAYTAATVLVALFFAAAAVPAHDANAFALALALQHGVLGSLLFLLVGSVRLRRRNPDSRSKAEVAVLRTFHDIWCHALFAARVVLQYLALAGALSRLGDEALVPAVCDPATGRCANPCEGNLGLVSKYNEGESAVPLLPVLWNWDAASVTAAADVPGNEWIGRATTLHRVAQYESLLRALWWSYVLTGPLYQCARVLAHSSPRETRNYLFRRLLQDYRPRAQGLSRRKRFAINVLIWVRYRLLLLRAMSMEVRLLYVLAYWPARGAARLYASCMDGDKPSTFAQMVVLRESQSTRRCKLAKYVAAAWYFFSLAFYVLLPACVLFLTIESELSIRGWVPQTVDYHDVSQWIAWALVGGAGAAYIVWYLLFEYLPKMGLRSRRWEPLGERERIYITDPSSEAGEPDKIALMEKNMQYNDLGWHKYILARIMVEWYDFRYWWRDPVQASAAAEGKNKKSDDPWDWDETYRSGGGPGEITNWAAFPSELASRPMPAPSGRHQICAAPAPRPIVEYSYDDEAETQRLLREQDGRRRNRG